MNLVDLFQSESPYQSSWLGLVVPEWAKTTTLTLFFQQGLYLKQPYNQQSQLKCSCKECLCVRIVLLKAIMSSTKRFIGGLAGVFQTSCQCCLSTRLKQLAQRGRMQITKQTESVGSYVCLTYSRTTGLLRLLERYCICFSPGVRRSSGTANKQKKHFYLS